MAGRGARAAVEVAADLVKMDKDYLVLKRASASRLSGEWSDDDFDVLCGGVVVGRIMKAAAVPAYRRLRMPRKHPQLLGADLNCSEW